jgi:hypothetical protein
MLFQYIEKMSMLLSSSTTSTRTVSLVAIVVSPRSFSVNKNTHTLDQGMRVSSCVLIQKTYESGKVTMIRSIAAMAARFFSA